MKRKIKWGILGAGNIAKSMATAINALDDAELHAVGSRSLDKARDFASQYNIPNAFRSYEELADSDVDIIYVCTPHPFHCEMSIMCMNKGKAVLCEKPMAMNERQVQSMIECAKKNNVFLMEGMWSSFFPAIKDMKKKLSNGIIGDIRHIKASFCFCPEKRDPEGRLLNPELGGGALLDVGVYTIAFALNIMARFPDEIISAAEIGNTGVDEQAAIIFKYNRGEMVTLNCAVQTTMPPLGAVYGTKGMITLLPFWQANSYTVTRNEQEEIFEFDRIGNGYCFEVAEAMECIRKGLLQSDTMPWSKSLDIVRVMDTCRKQWNLTYPCE